MPGGEICVPTHLNSVQIREEIHQRIAEGRYFIGEPCVESVLVRYKAQDGSVKREEITINARRIPVLEIRKRLLTKHAHRQRIAGNATRSDSWEARGNTRNCVHA